MRILLFLLLLAPTVIWAFDYPTGIPNAWIEPDTQAPTAPADWSEEVTNNYYVDVSSPNCSYSVTYGSVTTPKCKIPSTLQAGAYVEIHGGTYDYTTTVYIKSYGTATAPAWIVGAEGNEVAFHLVISGTYLYVDGLNLVDSKGFDIRPYKDFQTDHILIRNSIITGNGLPSGASGISASGENGLHLDGFIAYNNTVSYMGDSEATFENDKHAFKLGSNINNGFILYNTSHHNGGDGVQFSHNAVDAHHLYYGGNISHDERENCVDIKMANDVVISENTCYNIEVSNSSPGECMVVHYDPSRIWFINNDISECISGIKSTGAFDVHIIGNNIHGMREDINENHSDISSYQSGEGIALYNSGNAYISHNTITDTVRGIAYEALQGRKIEITNNIVTNLRNGEYTGNNPYAIMLKGNTAAVANSTIENNLFFNPMRLYVGNTIYTDLSALVASGKCAVNEGSCLSADPLFGTDYRLKSNSPAVDKGVVPSSYAIFQELYGTDVSISSDIDGVIRSISPDIGAYEYVNSALLTTPAATTDTSIQILNDN